LWVRIFWNFMMKMNKIKYIGERKYPIYTNKYSKTLYKGTPIAHPTVIIKTEILKKYQYDSNLFFSQDIDLWFRLILDGYSIENIGEPLLKYRITENTFLKRNHVKALAEFKIYYYYLIKLHGFSYLLIFPLLRFVLRLLPIKMIKKMYFSEGRRRQLM